MKKTFTKLFVAFLALLLAPSGVWADDYPLLVNGTGIDGTEDVANVLTDEPNNGKVSYTASTKTLTLADGAALTSIVNNSVDDLEIYIAQGSNVTLQSLTCNAPVTVYGGGTLNVSSTSGSTVSIGEEGSLTIGKNGQEAPMNVNLTSTDNEGCCIHFNDNIATVAFTVIGSNVTLTGIPTNANGFDGEDEDAVAAYVDCTLDLNADPITITANGGSAESDAVGDVFYTETTIGGGTLRLPYIVLTLPEGDNPGTVALGDDNEEGTLSYSGDGQVDLVIPTTVTSPKGNEYIVTELQELMGDAGYGEISFIRSITIPATITSFGIGWSFFYIVPKNGDEPGMETVIFADDCSQDNYDFGEDDEPFATMYPQATMTLVIPDSWDDVSADWGGGNWTGTKVIPLTHYQIWINDGDDEVEVSSLNKDDVLGDGGGVTYDPDTKELTITTDIQRISNGSVGYVDPRPGVDGLKIVIPEGKTVEISMVDVGTYSAINLINNTVITGGGTLNVSHRINTCIELGDFEHGNSIAANLTIKDVTVNVFPIGQTAKGIRFVNHESSLTVSHATLHIENQDGGEDYGEAEDATIIGYAENMPTLINCEITTTPEPAWAVLTGGYHNTGDPDEENLAWGYQVPTLTITAGASSTITAEVEDGSADDVTVDLELLSANKVAIVGVDGTETVTGVMQVPATVTVAGTKMSVTSIADNAFENQSGMTGITLPKDVTSIGAGAFTGCTGLQTVTLQSPFVPTIGADAFDSGADLTVAYPAAAYSNYNDLEWGGVATFQPTVMQPNEWSTICSTQDYTLPDGIDAYIVVGIDYENCAVQVKAVEGIKAGVPMMIRKTGTDEDYAVTASNITITDTGDQLATTVGDDDAFVGYAPLSDEVAPMAIPTETSGTPYILINGTFVKWTEGNLAPYRCFLWATQAFNTGAAPQMGIEIVDGETTGVGDVRGKKDDVRGEWYDLSGRKLQGKPTQKGVYIINGKKVNVK